jgi:DnaK suppressor protein
MERRKNTLNRERYEVLKAMLIERRREIDDRLRSIRSGLPAQLDDVQDMEEQSVSDLFQDMDFAVMQMKADTLAKIDEALLRLEDGTYGTCAECENEIAEARLQAVPFATLCRDCQEEEETRVASERPSVREPVFEPR